MNTDYIFKLFNNSIQHASDDQIEREIMESAHYNAKMFIKYITNLKNFQLKLLMVAQKKADADIEKDKQKAEYLGFNKAFNHISNINLYNQEHIHDLDLINPFDLSYCIQVTKTYFLLQEDFEKVAFLYEFADFVEKRYENLQIEE